VVVDDPENPFVEPDTSAKDSSTAITHGLVGYMLFDAARPIQVFDMQGRYLGRSLTKVPGIYLVRQGVKLRQVIVR
jgi:hypothetical protein